MDPDLRARAATRDLPLASGNRIVSLDLAGGAAHVARLQLAETLLLIVRRGEAIHAAEKTVVSFPACQPPAIGAR